LCHGPKITERNLRHAYAAARKQDSGVPTRSSPFDKCVEKVTTAQPDTAVDLAVELGRLRLKNPILVASGTFGYAREMLPFVNIATFGGIVPKTVTANPRAGNPTPRIVETAAGMLNAIGLNHNGR
jgi:hypothetical protein